MIPYMIWVIKLYTTIERVLRSLLCSLQIQILAPVTIELVYVECFRVHWNLFRKS